MPIYLFEHPKTKKVIEVVLRMSEPHIYVDAAGVQWNRIFSIPQAAMDTRISATDKQEFISKTRSKKMSVGDMWDMSAELSEKRGGTTGHDEIRVKAEAAYKEKTGKKHPHAQSRKQKKFLV
jgi:hypothetical protein